MIIVSDSSPLIGLSQIGRLDLINYLFNEVIIPPAVATECTLHPHKPGAKKIQEAINDSRLTIFAGAIDHLKNLSAILGPGEIEAISLAKQLIAPLLIDERLGRIAAKQNNISIIGTGGLLLSAKKMKIIPLVKPLIDQLINTGYRISLDLQQSILKLANE